jgi:nucleotide-binding universal stress UspA family protein
MPRPLTCILAATDLTARSAQVVTRAVDLARSSGAELIVVHVLADGRRPLRAALGGIRARLKLGKPVHASEKRLQQIVRQAGSDLGRPVGYRIRRGPVETTLAELAREDDAALIIMGLHRERRIMDVLRLTTMERAVLALDAPVLIAHRPVPGPYRRVLGLTDFLPGSARALAWAGIVAPGAEFHALHALTLPMGAKLTTEDPATDAALTRAEQLRVAFLSNGTLPALKDLPEILPGGLHDLLALRLPELGADLLTIGTYSGRDPKQLGSYARDLMRKPPVDLLVVKPGV